MQIDRDPETGAVRVDEAGFDALVSASRGAAVPEARTVLEADGLGAALAAVTEPVVTLGLVVAGASVRLRHRIWVDADRAVLLPELRPGASQLLVQPPGHLAAALVRLARLRPRRTGEREPRPFPSDRLDDLVAPDDELRTSALSDAGADFAWRLKVAWSDERRSLSAVDGPEGLFLADPDADTLRPVSNTAAYRLFATALPPAALPAGG